MYSADSGVGKTYHDVLLREDVSAVIVALPIISQPEYIEAALAAGKHVLAEKPIAGDVAGARRIIDYYEKTTAANNRATLAIAENYRFTASPAYARDQAAKLGKLTHFSIRLFSLMKDDTKWYGTSWRKTPEHQGGFLLDAGVHYAAVARMFLSGEARPNVVRALTSQAQPHLPPIDTVNAIITTKSGVSGSFQHSAGTLLSAFQWDFGFEHGTLSIDKDTVTVTPKDGKPEVKEFDRAWGVAEEVKAWAQAMLDGKPNPLQSPQEALADLEFLEKMFRSGEQDGAVQKYEFQ